MNGFDRLKEQVKDQEDSALKQVIEYSSHERRANLYQPKGCYRMRSFLFLKLQGVRG